MNTETEIAVLRAIIEEKEKTIKTITDLLNTLSANIANQPTTDFFGNRNGFIQNGIHTSDSSITYIGTSTMPSSYYISTGINNNAFTFSSRSV